MRKLFLWIFLISNIGFCQFFDSSGDSESSVEFFEDKEEKDQQKQTEEKSLSEIIFGTNEEDDDESAFFYADDEEDDEPEQGEDAGGNPSDPVPISNWLLILPIAASIIAFKFLYNPKNRKTVNKG